MREPDMFPNDYVEKELICFALVVVYCIVIISELVQQKNKSCGQTFSELSLKSWLFLSNLMQKNLKICFLHMKKGYKLNKLNKVIPHETRGLNMHLLFLGIFSKLTRDLRIAFPYFTILESKKVTRNLFYNINY